MAFCSWESMAYDFVDFSNMGMKHSSKEDEIIKILETATSDEVVAEALEQYAQDAEAVYDFLNDFEEGIVSETYIIPALTHPYELLNEYGEDSGNGSQREKFVPSLLKLKF